VTPWSTASESIYEEKEVQEVKEAKEVKEVKEGKEGGSGEVMRMGWFASNKEWP
jgi:hypothetical protein